MRTTVPYALVCWLLVGAGCNRNQGTEASHTGHQPATSPAEVTVAPGGRVEIVVDNNGYHPSVVRAQTPGQPVTLVFRRTADEGGCGEEVVFPALNLRRRLPPGQPVELTVTPSQGTLAFACGMDMYRGSIVVR